MEISVFEKCIQKLTYRTRHRNIKALQERKVVAKRPNGEDSLEVKMNRELSKTEDESFEQSVWGKGPGKSAFVGSTVPHLPNTLKDVPLSSKHTLSLEEEYSGKMVKAANFANGSKMRKTEDKLHMEKTQNVPDKLKKMEKEKPVTYPSENPLEMPADLREKRLEKNKPSVPADIQPMTVLDLQANMTDTCGKKPKNLHKKTEKGKPVTSPVENVVEMPADPTEKRSKENDRCIADNKYTMKLSSYVQTEKGKPVTNPGENATWMSADLGEKRPKENRCSPFANVQVIETSDVQANRTDLCGKNPKDHKKTKKEKLVTSPVENIVELPIDIGMVGTLVSDPQVHAEKEPSVLNWASSNPGFQVSIPHAIIQSTMSQGRRPVKRQHAVDHHDPDSPCIKKMKHSWQASADLPIDPMKCRHEDQHIFDNSRFKKMVWDLAEQFETLSI